MYQKLDSLSTPVMVKTYIINPVNIEYWDNRKTIFFKLKTRNLENYDTVYVEVLDTTNTWLLHKTFTKQEWKERQYLVDYTWYDATNCYRFFTFRFRYIKRRKVVYTTNNVSVEIKEYTAPPGPTN